MRETVSEFRAIFLVRVLQRLPDGSYVALNRRYKPVGHAGLERVEYEGSPGRFKFKRALTARQAAALSFEGDPCTECIYLYDDTCIPTASAAHWAAYSERLRRLAGYLVVH